MPLLGHAQKTVLRVGLVEHFAPPGARGGIARGLLAERLILCVFGYGTNIGLRAIAAGEHGHTEDDLRYVRRRYLSVEGARGFANAILAARGALIWGAGTGAVAPSWTWRPTTSTPTASSRSGLA